MRFTLFADAGIGLSLEQYRQLAYCLAMHLDKLHLSHFSRYPAIYSRIKEQYPKLNVALLPVG